MARNVVKRSGKTTNFNAKKIYTAITKANKDVKTSDPLAKIMTNEDIVTATNTVIDSFVDLDTVNIEDIQDTVEKTLMSLGFFEVAKSYILYRKKHQEQREAADNLMKQYRDILYADAADSDDRRENANINTNTPMGQMLKLGTEGAKVYANYYQLPEEFSIAEKEGWCHWHDSDFQFITFNCLMQDLSKLFKGGFNTGHGFVREPNSIRSYAALACIAIQCSQNSCFGGQAVLGWDFTMAEGIRKTFKTSLEETEEQFFALRGFEDADIRAKNTVRRTSFKLCRYSDDTNKTWEEDKSTSVQEISNTLFVPFEVAERVYLLTCKKVQRETAQAMEAAIHNFCTLHSRAGSQVPFSSINYGMDTTPEGRLAIRATLQATWNGLGDGETAIFPVQIFQIKSGVNYNPEDPNYDLFKLSMRVSAKRLFPNYNSVDASFNLPYYRQGDYRTYAATMGK